MVIKSIGAIVRVKDTLLNEEKAIPFGFKMNADDIPRELNPKTEGPFSPCNTIKVLIPGQKVFSCGVFAVGESSTEIQKVFEENRKKPTMNKIKGLKEKIVYWVPIDGVKILDIGFQSISEKLFDSIMSQFRKSVKRTHEKSSFMVNEGASTSTARAQETVTQESSQPSGHSPTTQTVRCDAVSINTLKIPEEDKTFFTNDGIVMLEGELPLKSADYKRAISELERESDQAKIMKKLIKYTFPKNWVNGVTLTGQSPENPISLISIWNFKDPFKTNFERPCEIGLGQKRLEALIRNVLRKARKMEYTNDDVKNLKKVISLSLSNKRNSAKNKRKRTR